MQSARRAAIQFLNATRRRDCLAPLINGTGSHKMIKRIVCDIVEIVCLALFVGAVFLIA